MANESANPSAAGGSSKSPAAQGASPRETQQAAGQGSTQRGGTQQPSTRLARREAGGPFGFWGTGPFTLMRRMLEDMDRLFEDSGSARFGPTGGRDLERQVQRGALWAPRVEVFERDGRLVVRADLPGLNKEDVQVEVTDDAITIEGERRQEREIEGAGTYRSEVSYGSFFRAIPLPEGAHADDAEARFANGVLEITVPLEQQRTQAKRLQVQDASSQPNVH